MGSGMVTGAREKKNELGLQIKCPHGNRDAYFRQEKVAFLRRKC
jgi:hypothetical protein